MLFLIQFATMGDFHAPVYTGVLVLFFISSLNFRLSDMDNAVYIALARTGWGVAVAWIAIACCKGYGSLASALVLAGDEF